MATRFCPTSQHIAEYRQLRAHARKLSEKLTTFVPEAAFTDIGIALGMLIRGTLVLDNESEMPAFWDCCLFDWDDADGRNVVEQYVEAYPPRPGSLDSTVLDAYLKARYRVLEPLSIVREAGVHCRDAWTSEELFVMDVGLSRTTCLDQIAMATRTCPVGDYWITTGAGLPIPRDDEIAGGLAKLAHGREGLAANLSGALLVVSVALKAGAGQHARFEDLSPRSKRALRDVPAPVPVRAPSPAKLSGPDPTDLCHCRSGLMYKYCCGRVKTAAAATKG